MTTDKRSDSSSAGEITVRTGHADGCVRGETSGAGSPGTGTANGRVRRTHPLCLLWPSCDTDANGGVADGCGCRGGAGGRRRR